MCVHVCVSSRQEQSDIVFDFYCGLVLSVAVSEKKRCVTESREEENRKTLDQRESGFLRERAYTPYTHTLTYIQTITNWQLGEDAVNTLVDFITTQLHTLSFLLHRHACTHTETHTQTHARIHTR